MKTHLISLTVLAGLIVGQQAQATIVFNDDFTRDNNTAIGNNWVETSSGGSTNASINTNELVIAGTGGGTGSRTSVAQPLTNFTAPFNATLSSNPDTVVWTFNVRQDGEPGGLNGGRTGAALILASDAADFRSTQGADGYAIVIAQPNRSAVTSTADPVTLVKFTNGVNTDSSNIATYTSLVTASTGVFADIGTELLSIRVEYVPTTNTFSVYGRNDGNSAFSDPANNTGFTFLGSAVDSTYTGTASTHMGAFFNNNGLTTQVGRFDNISVSIIPEPASLALVGIGLAMIVPRRRQR